jgi:hypothetical protein|tara:strand:- start:806 stop:1705 length:900 start_codon:yes stop_codon:yes gene_type:complete
MKNASLPDGFFLGQIPPNWNEYSQGATWQDAHNHRVKVRIPGKHSKGNEICDKDLPWAIVEQSTSSGNLNGSSVGLWGGEWVTGYFLDKDEQIPVITGVLGPNTIQDGTISKSACSTEFKPVSRYANLLSKDWQTLGAPKPPGPANPSLDDINAATEGIGEGSKSDAELKAELEAEGQTKDLFNNPNVQNPEEAPGLQATLPVATNLKSQKIPPPATYSPLAVGAQVEGNTGPFGRVLTEPQSRFPGGPQYQLISDGNEGSGTKTRWIDNPYDTKFDEARAAAGKSPILNKTEPGGLLW